MDADGGGIRLTMAPSTASTPSPVLAEICNISLRSRPKVDCSCKATRSGCEAGISICVNAVEEIQRPVKLKVGNLVDNRDDSQAPLLGDVEHGNGLGLNTLRGIY